MSGFDSDTPVEELPGILGYQWDDFDFVSLSEATQNITADFVRDFDEQAAYLHKPIGSKVKLGSEEFDVTVEPGERLMGLLGVLPAIDVQIDCPPDQGPASGSGYLIFLADGHTVEQAKIQIDGFLGAMARTLEEMLRVNEE